MGSSGHPPCAQTGLTSSLGTSLLNFPQEMCEILRELPRMNNLSPDCIKLAKLAESLLIIRLLILWPALVCKDWTSLQHYVSCLDCFQCISVFICVTYLKASGMGPGRGELNYFLVGMCHAGFVYRVGLP